MLVPCFLPAVDVFYKTAFQQMRAGLFADMADAVHLIFAYIFGVCVQYLIAVFFRSHSSHLSPIIGQRQVIGVMLFSQCFVMKTAEY